MPEAWAQVVEWLQLPFMQRALLGGILTGVTGAFGQFCHLSAVGVF